MASGDYQSCECGKSAEGTWNGRHLCADHAPLVSSRSDSTEGWKKAHRTLFSMAMRRQVTPTEYIEACRYWDDLYAGYRTDLDPECPTCGSQYCAAGTRGCAGA